MMPEHAALATLAVIPTVGLFGPLALLAMLFPALFGGLALWLRRWLVLLTVASLDSTLFLLHAWFRSSLRGHWWGSEAALWGILAALAFAGAACSWQRSRAAFRAGAPERVLPRRSDAILLGLVSLVGIGVVGWCLAWDTLTVSPWRQLLPLWIIAWAGLLYLALAARLGWFRRARGLHVEALMLGVLAVVCIGFGVELTRHEGGAIAAGTNHSSRAPHLLWQFWPHQRGLIASSPVVAGDRVYAAALVFDGTNQSGMLYCLDRATGHELWHFNDGGAMKPVFSTPCVADGRLYIGEGFHQDAGCKLYCLDANSGVLQWSFQTTSHTEATPCVAAGRLYFGAGDDGVYCLDATSGTQIWHTLGWHVDTRVAVTASRVYGGSGYGTLEMFCLDAQTGRPLWRTPSPLSVFGSPVVAGGRAFFGIGNGDLDHSADHPAGALMCLDAKSGQQRWRYPTGDGVHVRPAVADGRVYCVSRDGHCSCVDRESGKLVWSVGLGSPLVTAPQLAGADVYVLTSAGRVCCVDAATGASRWSLELAPVVRSDVRLRSSPCLEIVRAGAGERRCLYFGADATNILNSEPLVVALEDEQSAQP